jgi:hypothetical protein
VTVIAWLVRPSLSTATISWPSTNQPVRRIRSDSDNPPCQTMHNNQIYKPPKRPCPEMTWASSAWKASFIPEGTSGGLLARIRLTALWPCPPFSTTEYSAWARTACAHPTRLDLHYAVEYRHDAVFIKGRSRRWQPCRQAQGQREQCVSWCRVLVVHVVCLNVFANPIITKVLCDFEWASNTAKVNPFVLSPRGK